MEYASTTTLKAIREASPRAEGWVKLLGGLGKKRADNDPLDLITILEINGLDDALWVLSYAMPDDRMERHFRACCADSVLHLFEAKYPDDMRVREQIAMLRNDTATEDERTATRSAASAAAQDALWDAASAAAWDAARSAASAAAWDAARSAAWAVARDAQEKQLRKMLGQ